MLINSIEGKNRRKTLVIEIDRLPMAPNKLLRCHWSVRKQEVDAWNLLLPISIDPPDRLALRKNAQKPSTLPRGYLVVKVFS